MVKGRGSGKHALHCTPQIDDTQNNKYKAGRFYRLRDTDENQDRVCGDIARPHPASANVPPSIGAVENSGTMNDRRCSVVHPGSGVLTTVTASAMGDGGANSGNSSVALCTYDNEPQQDHHCPDHT